MKYKYKLSLSVIAVFLIFGSLLLINYGIYKKSLSKNYIALSDSKCINVIYSDDTDLLLVNPRTLSDEDGMANIPRTITIINKCSSDETVSLYLDYYDDSTIKDSKMKVSINGDVNINPTILSNISKVLGSGNVKNTYKLINIDVNKNETKRLNLRLWLDENEVVTANTNRFHSKYYVYSDKEIKINNISDTILNNSKDNLKEIDNNYYFTGNVTNNYIRFADMLWKIVAINSDKTIKVVYANNDLESVYNDNIYKDESVAYENSKVKELLDAFYQEKLSQYDKFIVEKEFNNDTSYERGWKTTYGSYKRNIELNEPSIKPYETDKQFGGNKKYKIGLLTLDELNIAGASSEDNNYYLNEGVDYYTMSPAVFNGSAYMCIINSNGQMDATSTRYKLVVKPVINLIDSLEIVGQGTAESPYLT